MQAGRHQLVFPAALAIGLLVGPLVATAPGASAASTPSPQRITGVLQTIISEPPPAGKAGSDADNHAAHDTTKVLRVGSTIVPLADGSLPTTRDGSTVSVSVAPAGDGTKQVLAVSKVAAPAAPTALAVPPAHKVYVALVLPAGVTADTSLSDASARAMVTKVSSYWSSQTGGKVSFSTAQVLPSYRSAYSCTDTSTSTYNMWAEALRKMPAASGPGRHLVLVAPGSASSRGCAYGLGTIGAVEATGNKVFASGLNQSLLAHELGHNLGLYHSNALRCTGTQDVTVVSSAFPGCQASPYDDLFDVMGYSGTNYGEGSLNAVHLSGMNLLPTAVRNIVAGPGVTTARITPLSTTTANRTLRVTDPSGAVYFVEYRTNSGRDTVAARNPWRPSWGVRVLRSDPATPASSGSYELDSTPTSLSSSDYNRSIPVGGTFRSASRGLTIRVAAQDAAGATLTITNAAAPLVPFTVTQSVPAKALVGAGLTAATRVTNRQGSAVANWKVTLQKQQKGTTTWRSVRSLRTSSAGTASHWFANGVSGHYRWVTAPVAGTPARTSASVAITSTARVHDTRPATSLARATFLKVTGSVSSVPAPVVYIQYRYAGGSWHTGPRATVAGRAVSGRIRLSVRATAYTRLYVRPATSYAGSVSAAHATIVR
jgi:Metallo-peptidase family M12B Reprolysin-like